VALEAPLPKRSHLIREPSILMKFVDIAATSSSGSPKISEHLEQHSRNLEPDDDYFHFAKSLFQFYIRTGI